ncbi:MAG: hypothetical protein E6J47_08690 [Chloroflexi bacterium]|nr:MAG: hypothetical protein E6J47_08690 [Chloroflexota bacterium]
MWLVPAVVLALAAANAPLIAPGSAWEKLAGGLGFGEGPAWHPDGYLLFEDVTNKSSGPGLTAPAREG